MSEFEDLFSSQGSRQHEETLSELPASSPLAPTASRKPRRPPTITPKRFTRFFTPRQGVEDSRKPRQQSSSARRLRDITRNAVNHKVATTPCKATKTLTIEDIENEEPQGRKRRKLSPSFDSSPIQSSPLKRTGQQEAAPIIIFQDIDKLANISDVESDVDSLCDDFRELPTPVRRLRDHSSGHRLLQRSFGGPRAIGRGRLHDVCADWQDTTANFHTLPEDSHSFRGSALPFCTTACNSNSMVAIGDEEGGIRLVDTANTEGSEFGKEHVAFRPHHNAIMDIAFSSDDYLFATASGDQTARVIDMRTQQTRYIMAGHCSSVKQVRFQPGNDSVLASSSRDGSVQIWDLRCRGSNAPVKDIRLPIDPEAGASASSAVNRQVIYANTCISIKDAHSHPPLTSTTKTGAGLFDSRPEAARRADVSITALTFMPHGREHLFLTASEANASVKLWDIRARYASRGPAMPIATTCEPQSHINHRRFGLSSLTLSGDGTRLYSLCKDSTVYAYSTNHLVLGAAPELSASNTKWKRSKDGQAGLGPLYGFRHPQLKATSFYVKASTRPARGDKDEMLAVGSRDGCAVLFPTNESYFKKQPLDISPDDGDDDLPALPSSRRPLLPQRASSKFGSSSRGKDTIPIHEQGTALVRGHQSEVTGLAWTYDGDLVTIGDDYQARCWRQGSQARELRTQGEGEGKRWNCGWADVRTGYDDDE